jgi:RNA polymerase sigma-70 factor (ECF subfamily)
MVEGNLKKPSDELLMEKVMNHDMEAYEILVKRYQDKIINFVYRMVNNYAVAEELTQETFLRVFRKAHTFRLGAHFSTWLYRIATNLSINEIKKMNRATVISLEKFTRENRSEINLEEFTETRDSPDKNLINKELREAINRNIQEIPPKYKGAFILRDIQGMSYEEIAGILNCPLGTVKSRVNRARLFFKELMKPYVGSSQEVI